VTWQEAGAVAVIHRQLARTAESATADRIERAILEVRGHRVVLDAMLAALYGLSTKRLNEQRSAIQGASRLISPSNYRPRKFDV
jgi:ORF6N domain